MARGVRRSEMKTRLGASRRFARVGWFMGQVWRAGKVLFVCLFISVVVCALWAGGVFERLGNWAHDKYIGATANMGLMLEDVQVRGRHFLPAAELRRAIDVMPGVPLMSVDLADVQARVSTLSWVKEVRVRRTLGGVMVIDIQERVPVALWVDANPTPAIIDDEGVVLTRDNLNEYAPILAVSGEGANTQAYGLMLLLQAEPDVAVRVKQANYISGRRWDLVMDGGTIVRLPEKDVGLALARLAKAQLEKRMLDFGYASIDLRHEDRIIVENKPEDALDSLPKGGNAV